jgi:copper chaperone CopZ
MTKVDLEYDLLRPLGDSDLDAIARVHGVYGIHRVKLRQPSLDAITVEYDASRLSEEDVERALLKAGIPIVRQ